MHHVYLVTFTKRKENSIFPCFYIGSKSNAMFENSKLFSSKNREYRGSSTDEEYNKLISSEEPKILEILFSSEDYADVLQMEKSIQIQNDVVASVKFFNKSLAMENVYHNPNYGTFRHIITKKCVRLPKDHPLVISKEYVNANQGMKTYNNGICEKQFFEVPDDNWKPGRLEKNIRRGDDCFFSKMPIELRQKATISRTEMYKENPDVWEKIRKSTSERSKKLFLGVPKTQIFKDIMSVNSKNKCILKNVITLECIKISRDELETYDRNIWVNPYAYSRRNVTADIVKCPFCEKESDSKNSSFRRHHFDKCKKNPKRVATSIMITCPVCNKTSISSPGFIGHHFDNCKEYIWCPWERKPCGVADNVYKNIPEFKKILGDDLYSKSMKLLTTKIMKTFDFTKEQMYYVRTSLNKLREGFDPQASGSWIKKFIKENT